MAVVSLPFGEVQGGGGQLASSVGVNFCAIRASIHQTLEDALPIIRSSAQRLREARRRTWIVGVFRLLHLQRCLPTRDCESNRCQQEEEEEGRNIPR